MIAAAKYLQRNSAPGIDSWPQGVSARDFGRVYVIVICHGVRERVKPEWSWPEPILPHPDPSCDCPPDASSNGPAPNWLVGVYWSASRLTRWQTRNISRN